MEINLLSNLSERRDRWNVPIMTSNEIETENKQIKSKSWISISIPMTYDDVYMIENQVDDCEQHLI